MAFSPSLFCSSARACDSVARAWSNCWTNCGKCSSALRTRFSWFSWALWSARSLRRACLGAKGRQGRLDCRLPAFLQILKRWLGGGDQREYRKALRDVPALQQTVQVICCQCFQPCGCLAIVLLAACRVSTKRGTSCSISSRLVSGSRGLVCACSSLANASCA
jgi:hypothetical protein